MLQTYRQIFTPATARFSLVGLVARLPISMVGLGIVLLAEHERSEEHTSELQSH